MSIPLSVPHLAGNEWTYVKECLDTNWVSSGGAFVTRFEQEVAKRLGVKQAVACVNGTAALHLALLVSGVKPEEEVLIPALTFVAPANTIRYVGAWPVFMDVEENHWQMDPQKVAEFLRTQCEKKTEGLFNRQSGRKVAALLPVDILGHPVDMDPLLVLAQEYGLTIIEDATESLGARYKGRPVGAGVPFACLSFNGNKIITTGGGGMIVTDNEQWASRTRYLSTQAKDDPVEYIHEAIGFNYRLTNIQAAFGVAQLEQLDTFVQKKHAIAQMYRQAFADTAGITLQEQAPWATSTFWLSTVRIDSGRFGMDSRQLMKRLAEQGIEARPLWHPLHTLTPFRQCQSYKVSVANLLYRECLSLPSSVGLSEEDQNRVIAAIQSACRPSTMVYT